QQLHEFRWVHQDDSLLWIVAHPLITDNSRPLPGEKELTVSQVHCAFRGLKVRGFQSLELHDPGVQLAAAYLRSMNQFEMAQQLERMVWYGLVRRGSVQGLLATSILRNFLGQRLIILSDAYPEFNSVTEAAVSLVHEMGAIVGFTHERSEEIGEGLRSWLGKQPMATASIERRFFVRDRKASLSFPSTYQRWEAFARRIAGKHWKRFIELAIAWWWESFSILMPGALAAHPYKGPKIQARQHKWIMAIRLAVLLGFSLGAFMISPVFGQMVYRIFVFLLGVSFSLVLFYGVMTPADILDRIFERVRNFVRYFYQQLFNVDRCRIKKLNGWKYFGLNGFAVITGLVFLIPLLVGILLGDLIHFIYNLFFPDASLTMGEVAEQDVWDRLKEFFVKGGRSLTALVGWENLNRFLLHLHRPPVAGLSVGEYLSFNGQIRIRAFEAHGMRVLRVEHPQDPERHHDFVWDRVHRNLNYVNGSLGELLMEVKAQARDDRQYQFNGHPGLVNGDAPRQSSDGQGTPLWDSLSRPDELNPEEVVVGIDDHLDQVANGHDPYQSFRERLSDVLPWVEAIPDERVRRVIEMTSARVDVVEIAERRGIPIEEVENIVVSVGAALRGALAADSPVRELDVIIVDLQAVNRSVPGIARHLLEVIAQRQRRRLTTPHPSRSEELFDTEEIRRLHRLYGSEVYPIFDQTSQRIVDVHPKYLERERVRGHKDTLIYTHLVSGGSLIVAGGRPFVDGSRLTEAWARFGQQHEGEIVKVYMRYGIVYRVVSLGSDLDEELKLIGLKKDLRDPGTQGLKPVSERRYQTSFWGRLTQEEADQLTEEHEIHNYRLSDNEQASFDV
ncbi:MAG: hypothetical protein NUV91_05710, partial [Candidatus Omnitrophica bacterium]|nr:hypothetical protein [Candidatus Omnitrophota bacterium]